MKRFFKTTGFTLGITFLLIACSQNKRHQVLSIFFDGVEPPDSTQSEVVRETDKATGRDASADLSRSIPTYYYHAIYQQKECSACHDSENANKLIEELPDLCYQCHSDFSEEFEYLHVPVAIGECGECHHPHLTQHEKLLIAQIQTLCFACHAEEDIRETETHSEIEETSCSDCHNPHGGEDEYLFR